MRARFLLNADLVVVDPYEEAQGIGECLPRAHTCTHAPHATLWAQPQSSVGSVLWPPSPPPVHGLRLLPPPVTLTAGAGVECGPVALDHHSQVRTMVVGKANP